MTEPFEVGVSLTLDEVLLDEIEKARGTIAVLERAAQIGGVPVGRLREVAAEHESAGTRNPQNAGDGLSDKAVKAGAAAEGFVTPLEAVPPILQLESEKAPDQRRGAIIPPVPVAELKADVRPSAPPLAVLRMWRSETEAAQALSLQRDHQNAPAALGYAPGAQAVPRRETFVLPDYVSPSGVDSGVAKFDQRAAPVNITRRMGANPTDEDIAGFRPLGAAQFTRFAVEAPVYDAPQEVPAAPTHPGQEPVAAAVFSHVAPEPALEPSAAMRHRVAEAVPQRTASAGVRRQRQAVSPAADTSEAPDGHQADGAHQIQGDVYLDGNLVGRWISRHLGREAERASANPTAFDARRGRLLPGPTVR